jgi:hypothetical protein
METIHLNPFQLSRRWGITPKTLQNWRSQGKGPAFIKVGGHVLYRMEDLEKYESERLYNTTSTNNSITAGVTT